MQKEKTEVVLRKREKDEKRKKIWIKLGVFSIYSEHFRFGRIPYRQQVEAKSGYLQAKENGKERISAEEYNKVALDFISLLKPEDFKTWDQSLGVMTEKEAEEIKTFLETTVIKDEKDDYQKAKKIYEWITKNIKYATCHQNIGLRPYDVFKYKVAVCGGFQICTKQC